ncbi:MAG: TMEM14 family protein [Thermostichales cyanobacterium BF4_bins_65]
MIQLILATYGILVMIGGWLGYRQAGSRKSLLSGLISGLVLLLAAGISLWQRPVGLGIGLVTAGILTGVFWGRWRATGKLMPAGLMLGFSGSIALLLAWALWRGAGF